MSCCLTNLRNEDENYTLSWSQNIHGYELIRLMYKNKPVGVNY